MKTYHFALIGDSGVGKTTFITRYPNLMPSYRMSDEQQYLHLINVPHDETNKDIIIWDIPSHPMLRTHTSLALEHSPVIYLCYAINDPASLKNAPTYLKFVSRKHQAVVLLGLKSELRNNTPQNHYLRYNDGFDFCIKYDLDAFMECSAVDDYNCIEALVLGLDLEKKRKHLRSHDGCVLWLWTGVVYIFKNVFGCFFNSHV